MIRKYLLDILCMVLVVVIAVLLAEGSAIDLRQPPALPEKRPSLETVQEETKKGEGMIVRYATTAKALEERNIFSPGGSYAVSKTGPTASLPEVPYTLIGILKGEESRAVLRDHTGSIVALTVGKKLSDGSVITRINTASVEVKKGKEKKELRIFDIKSPKPLTIKNP